MPDTSSNLPEGTVTVLFTDVVSSTELTTSLGDEQARRVMRTADEIVREEIARHRGDEVKGMGDGTMAAFRSARQAVECAIAIQKNLQRAQRLRSGNRIAIRIGLNSGDVIRERADIFGSAVNAAKRIESLAEAGTIFISETTRALLGSAPDITFVDRGQFDLKGFDTPWRLFEVPYDTTAETALRPDEPTPFVGREAEFQQLLGLLERAADGSGSIVFIGGEAGIGKTRLTDEIAREARERGMMTYVGHCQDVEGRQPYLPFVEMLERSLRVVPLDVLREALGPNAAEVAKLMPELRQRFDDIPESIELPPEQERRHLLNGVRDYLARGARMTANLRTFEDLQWADESTLLLIAHLAQHIDETPLLVIGTYRDTELTATHPLVEMMHDLRRQHLAHEIILKPLDQTHVAAMLERRGGSTSPEPIVDLVFEESDGNPFFVEELFRHLQESGKLFTDEGEWKRQVEIAPNEVPRNVRMLIERRIDRLSEDCRGALVSAAVVGRRFSYDVLCQLVDLDGDRLLDVLEEAERASIVKDATSGREVRYLFSHEQVRQTMLSTISLPRRQRIHARVAKALEVFYGDEAERHAAELAHHLFEAGAAAEAAMAARYLALAGNRALSALAYEEALWYADALGDSADGLLLRAQAYRGLARIDDSFTAFEHALRVAAPGAEHDAILRERAELLHSLFRDEAVQDFELLLQNARSRGDREAELKALLGLGSAYYVVALNDATKAPHMRETLEAAYGLARELGDKSAMARALIWTRWFTDFWPEYFGDRVLKAQEAVALANDVGDEGLILDAEGFRLWLLGPEERVSGYEDLRERHERSRDLLRRKEFYFLLMRYYQSIANFAGCVEICDKAIALAEELGVEPVMYPSIKAEALMDLGRYDEAWMSLQQEVTSESFGEALQRFDTAFYRAATGRADEAIPLARDAAALGEKFGRVWMVWMANGLLARLLIENGEPPYSDEFEAIFDTLRGNAKAEVLLYRGENEAARERASRFVSRAAADGRIQDLITGGEVLVRTLLMLQRFEEALEESDRMLARAEQAQFRPMIVKLLRSRSCAKSELGDEGGTAEDQQRADEIEREIKATIPA